MNRENSDEFYQVRRAACDGLRSGGFVGDTGISLCRLAVLPSFENSIAWDVRALPVTTEPSELRLFRSCWRLDMDQQVFRSPLERLKHARPYRPTVEVDSVPIDAAKFEGLISRLQAIPIPLAVAESSIGCDGTSYELSIGHLFCHSRIVWWERLPHEWKAIEPVVEAMMTFFDSSWNNS
jgi:hypothetical protein